MAIPISTFYFLISYHLSLVSCHVSLNLISVSCILNSKKGRERDFIGTIISDLKHCFTLENAFIPCF